MHWQTPDRMAATEDIRTLGNAQVPSDRHSVVPRTEGPLCAVAGAAYVTYWLGIHCFQRSTVTNPSRW